MLRPLIKWPGGKTGELEKLLPLFPKEYDRYVEPFFGGGAVFFALEPDKAAINDISRDLMEFYCLIKDGDVTFYRYLDCFEKSFTGMSERADAVYDRLLDVYHTYMSGRRDADGLCLYVAELISSVMDDIMAMFTEPIVKNREHFEAQLVNNVSDKLIRTAAHEKKSGMTDIDRVENFRTGFHAGYYMYFRDVYNDIILNRGPVYASGYRATVFYFVREYCYGSMFRYNKAGEFNIPYGGISYNNKNFRAKIDNMFDSNVKRVFSGCEVYSQDFTDFCRNIKVNEGDFIFLDPPYDTDFSDYEGRDFTRRDHERLAGYLSETPAKFLLVIKNTEFIRGLYEGRFNIATFENTYSYNVKSRNERDALHLVITNY